MGYSSVACEGGQYNFDFHFCLLPYELKVSINHIITQHLRDGEMCCTLY